MKLIERKQSGTMKVDEYTIQYSLAQAFDKRWFVVVSAPLHGLVMGSIKWFGLKQPSAPRLKTTIEKEARWHIKVRNIR